jgi:carbon monoxide dehydrogenase subunit G
VASALLLARPDERVGTAAQLRGRVTSSRPDVSPHDPQFLPFHDPEDFDPMQSNDRLRRSFLRSASVLVSGFAVLASTECSAHGPTRQKAIERITIAAPPAAVWSRIKNFDALKDWHPAIAESPADKGNAEGSVRRVKLKNGGELLETLESHDDAKMKYSYRAKDGGALPVSNYTSSITVTGEGNQSVVEWRGAFYRGYPNNDPPPEQNDEAAVKAVTGVYTSGLANLKKLAEGG